MVTEFLFNGNEESVKLDLSYCSLTSEYILKLNADASIVCCILELNLAGNPITLEVCYFIFSLSPPNIALNPVIVFRFLFVIFQTIGNM